jgi:hypothetical protein
MIGVIRVSCGIELAVCNIQFIAAAPIAHEKQSSSPTPQP